MPESERPEQVAEIESALDRLSAAVDRILADYVAVRSRSEELGREYASLREAVAGSGGAQSGDFEVRLGRLAAENKHLKETLLEARARAERIRNRLAVVEDEV